jgi:3-hydroxyacyl-[acyl-carrier-protein] dehydratase
MSEVIDTTKMTYKEIVAVLPHRFPFLFIDKVVDKQRTAGTERSGWKIKCIKNVTINEPFFAGHFPHRPVVPGVILIEMMAQAAALCNYHKDLPRQDVALCGIKDAKFRAPVVPGDVLEIDVECIKDRGSMMLFSGKISVEGKVVCDSEFLARMFTLVE